MGFTLYILKGRSSRELRLWWAGPGTATANRLPLSAQFSFSYLHKYTNQTDLKHKADTS